MQFIVLTFNHEEYIVEHLESIKFQVERFASESCSVSVIDDCSGDGTVEKADKWLRKNSDLFQNTEIVTSPHNVGISGNFIKAILSVKENRFKILAGDDLYSMNSVFDAVGRADLFVTPVIPFSEGVVEKCSLKSGLMFCYRYGVKPMSKETLRKDLSRGDMLSAPGVFLSRRVIEDDGLHEAISQYRNIEDLPMWHYLLNVKRSEIAISKASVPYVMYRVGSGVSTSFRSEASSQYNLDAEKIKKIVCPDLYRPLRGRRAKLARRFDKATLLPKYIMSFGETGAYRRMYESQYSSAVDHLAYIRASALDFEV